ncbi:Transcription factor bHLH117 [Striga hermonthica]|uniref:Transcription factor bHLH117 n=1 Tax=Striga hermonthica TaxID=68872 RepID=A0A9N7MF44_STRHE|nr:Transcription factor bHLH117 [Striga hermonthica]
MNPPAFPVGYATTGVEDAYIRGVQTGLNFRSLLDSAPLAAYDGVLRAPITSVPETAAPPPPSRVGRLPDLSYLDTAAGLESGFPIGDRFRKTRAQQQPRRRSTVPEKARLLQKLLPSEKRMDTAEVLEETHKYIRFLEAQVGVLRSMPCRDNCLQAAASEGGVDLGRLSRQELLQAVVNSPAAQEVLYTSGCCVCSAEQLEMIYDQNAVRPPCSGLWPPLAPQTQLRPPRTSRALPHRATDDDITNPRKSRIQVEAADGARLSADPCIHRQCSNLKDPPDGNLSAITNLEVQGFDTAEVLGSDRAAKDYWTMLQIKTKKMKMVKRTISINSIRSRGQNRDFRRILLISFP